MHRLLNKLFKQWWIKNHLSEKLDDVILFGETLTLDKCDGKFFTQSHKK